MVAVDQTQQRLATLETENASESNKSYMTQKEYIGMNNPYPYPPLF